MTCDRNKILSSSLWARLKRRTGGCAGSALKLFCVCAVLMLSTATCICGSLPPIVAITLPSSSGTFATTLDRISLGGYASDDVGIQSASWSSDRGEGGSFIPSQVWDIPNVQLHPGLNIITVAVVDGEKQEATDSIAIV